MRLRDSVEMTVLGRSKERVIERGSDLRTGGRRQVLSRTEFGLEWFAFTSAICFGQGRCSGHFHAKSDGARDVVQVACH